MTAIDDREQALNDFWNAIVAGTPASPASLDPGDREIVRFLQSMGEPDCDGPTPDMAWPKVLTRIMEGGRGSARAADPRPPEWRVSRFALTRQRPSASPASQADALLKGFRWLNALATAALLLITVAAALFALGPGRVDTNDRPPGAPALIGITSAAKGLSGEAPLDLAIGPMSAGPRQLLAGEVRLQPGVVMSEPPLSGLVLLDVEEGTIAVTLPDGETSLRAGDQITVPVDGEFAIRNDGAGEATFLQAFVLDAAATGGREFNTAAHYSVPGGGAGYWPIAVGADLPAGAGWLTLERVVIQPGAALPPFVATGLDWVAPYAGRVGMTLEGDRLPFRWDSGEERTFAAHDRGYPRFTPGTTVTLRNASDDDLVLLRLAITSLLDTPSP